MKIVSSSLSNLELILIFSAITTSLEFWLKDKAVMESKIKNKDNVILVLGVDEDDPARSYYNYIENNVPFVQIIEFKNDGKFLGLSTMWNNMAQQIDADIYAMIGDDMIFKTQDWDLEIINEFSEPNCPSDKIIMVHCNDGMRGPGNKYTNVAPLCVNFFIHKNYINITNYFVEPFIENTHHDTWVQIIFDSLKRTRYRHDILIKHLHYSESDGKMDDVSTNIEQMRTNIWNNNSFTVEYNQQISDEIKKLNTFIIKQ
jgi:hypothetical protein